MSLLVTKFVGIGLLAIAVFLITVYWKTVSTGKFSLRTLLLGISILAMGFAYFTSWQYVDRAETVWLASGSAEAKSLLPEAKKLSHPELFSAQYIATYQPIQKVWAQAEAEVKPPGYEVNFDNDKAVINCEDSIVLLELLAAMKEFDQQTAGEFVIRGIVEDEKQLPVRNAAIDLLGPYQVINVHKTRADGTFSIPVAAPPESGYLLRIHRGKQRILTRPFSLIDDHSEVVIRIRVK